MNDLLSKEVQELAQAMANEVLGDMDKQLSPKRKRAAFESWVIWRLAVLQVTLNRLCQNVEYLEKDGECELPSPGEGH